MVTLQKNQFLIIAETNGTKQADADWFDEDIDIAIGKGEKYGGFVVIDFHLSEPTELKYTTDGTNYESFDNGSPLRYGRRFVPVYNNSKFNIKSVGAVTVHRCKVSED